MKVADNSPVFEPAEGILVVERNAAAEAFEPNRFYVTPDCDATVRSMLSVDGMNSSKQVNQYVLELNTPMPDLGGTPSLREAMEREQANLVLALFTPCRTERYFIISRVESGDELRAVALMAYSAERITEHCMRKTLKIFAIMDPDKFLSHTHDLYSTSRFAKEYLKDMAGRVAGGPSFMGIVPSMPNIREALNIDGVVTHMERRKALDNMDKYLVENINRFKKKATTEEEKAERRKAEVEIDLVCSSIDGETVKRLFAIMSPSQRERALKLLDPREVAKASEMILSLEKVDVQYIRSRSTDGYYRLFLKKGNQSLPVHFARRASVVIYTIYMVDRYCKPEVDTLNLRLYRDAFVDLYDKYYHDRTEGEVRFGELWQKYDKRPQIYLCLNDIRQTLSTTCKQLDEIASPYILETEYSHLFVDKEKMLLPPELLELVR